MNNNIRILKNKYTVNGYKDSLFTRNEAENAIRFHNYNPFAAMGGNPLALAGGRSPVYCY